MRKESPSPRAWNFGKPFFLALNAGLQQTRPSGTVEVPEKALPATTTCRLPFPQHQPSGQLRVLEKRNLLFKAPLLQFYRLVPHETPTPGSLSEDSLLLPGRHQFELVGDVGFRDLNPTPSFSRTHASHEFVRRGFERLSSRQLKPRVFSARLYKGCLMLDNVSAER